MAAEPGRVIDRGTAVTAGGAARLLGPAEVAELERILSVSGLLDVSLARRYSVVFVYPGMGLGDVYPDLAGCTTEVCTFIEEAAKFLDHGIQVIGLSGEPSVPPPGCIAFPFPVGLLPQDELGGLVEAADKGERRYAARESYVLFPDGTGIRIGDVSDVVAHVKECFEVAMGRRCQAYREAALVYVQRDARALSSSVEFRRLLANGADSVSIPRVDLTFELVCKLADPKIVAEEARYMDRVNRLLEAEGRPRLFPAVVSICTDEEPGWYLMEAVNPVALDELAFADEARMVLQPEGLQLLTDALVRLLNLYEVTFRPEVPKVARYHYLDRFLAIPRRDDTRKTFELLFEGEGSLEEALARPIVLEGGFLCRPYEEQTAFLAENVGELLQPAGANLHGDLHLPNMLLGRDGESVAFIDPRIVWDGNDVGDPGFGDPMYDLGTLLHSLHVMSAILRAIDEGETEGLLGRLRIHGNPTVDWYLGWLERVLPREIRGPSWKARLHVNTANALLGWLKYARSVKTRHAWRAIFAAVLYHLELGRRHIERRER